jgi:hypothetical protein
MSGGLVTSSALVKPAYFNFPPYTKTLGPEVADLAALAGYAPDPEQALALDAMFALRPDGRAAALEFCAICARQNMKTALFKMAVLGWVFVTEQWLVVWSSHEMKTTKEAFLDLVTLIENCPPLHKRLAHVYRGNGDEAIELKSGQRVLFKARTNGGGRGLTGDKVILDEGFALKASHMAALFPTLSAVKDPQVVYGSSAGHAESEVLRGIRDRGRAGGDPRLAYMEFCAPEDICADPMCSHALEVEGCALDDIEFVRMANPALERRISIDYVRAERRAFGAIPAEFARERLGWWDKPEGDAEPAIDLKKWSDLADAKSEPQGDVAFGVYVNINRTSAAIGVVGRRADGKFHVGVVPAVRGKPIDSLPGTAWIPDRLKELSEWNPLAVVIDGHSAAASLIPAIEALGVSVTRSNGTDFAKACGVVDDAVTEGNVRHQGSPSLARSVTSAKWRELNDMKAWDRKDRGSDITQLNAVTLALHGFVTCEPQIYNLLDSVW